MTNRIDSAIHDHGFDPPPLNPQTFNSPWSNGALTERVKALWCDHSPLQIAQVINREFSVRLTRNSVVGKLHRLGLTHEHKSELSNRTPRAKRTTIPKTHRPKLHIVATGSRTAFRVMQSFETDAFEQRVVAVEPLNLSLADLPDSGCHFIAGNDGLYCGHPRREKSSFCPAHHDLIHVPPQPRKIGGWR